jgi:hypothetical protein
MAKGMVTKFISMWPREVWDLTEEASRSLLLRQVPELKEPGVYVLYREDVPFYIGQAGRLYKRLHDHANKSNDRYFNFWNFFSAFVSEKKYLSDIERILIAAMPTANSSMPKMDRAAMPPEMVRRIRAIRRHAVDPVTRQDLERLEKMQKRTLLKGLPADLSSRKGFSRS